MSLARPDGVLHGEISAISDFFRTKTVRPSLVFTLFTAGVSKTLINHCWFSRKIGGFLQIWTISSEVAGPFSGFLQKAKYNYSSSECRTGKI